MYMSNLRSSAFKKEKKSKEKKKKNNWQWKRFHSCASDKHVDNLPPESRVHWVIEGEIITNNKKIEWFQEEELRTDKTLSDRGKKNKKEKKKKKGKFNFLTLTVKQQSKAPHPPQLCWGSGHAMPEQDNPFMD